MKTKRSLIAAALLFAGGIANAALTPDELKQLGTTLTPWGAIKAGNKDGTIPAYEGGLPTDLNPPGFKPNSGHYPDPFASEKPLYRITAANMDKYADKLNDAQKEMLRRFPDSWFMDVFPTHRTVNYPKYFIDSSLKNASNPNCKLIQNELAIAGCKGGMPFPIPKSANEMMFNVIFGYIGASVQTYQSFYVDANGNGVTASKQETTTRNGFHDPDSSVEDFYAHGAPNSVSAIRYFYPARMAGTESLTLFVNDDVNNHNIGYTYNQGVRRVRISPEVGYDFPTASSGGSQFYDESTMFLGKLDKFNFKYLGLKEMIIPYNSYRINEAGPEVQTAAGGGHHPNPDTMRWELHRVHVVEGVLKPGERHAYSKRRLYIDEDESKMGMSEAWDQAGKIYKAIFMTNYWVWDKQNIWASPNIAYNLSTGVWYYSALMAGLPGFKHLDKHPPYTYYTAEALMRRNQR